MIDKLNISEEIDWTTVGLYLLLVVFGWMNIFASSYNDQFKSIFDIRMNYGEQLLWILASFILIILLFAIDHRFYHYFAYVIFGASILLLLSVLVFGVTVNNSRSWIRIFGFNLQPSELMKITTALAVARYLSGYNVKLWTWKSMMIVGLLIGLPVALIAVQPDWGTALVFSCFGLLLYREGMPGWILASCIFIATLFLMTLLMSEVTVVIILILFAIIGFGIINNTIRQSVIASVILIFFYFALKFALPWLPIKPTVYQMILISLGLSSIVFLFFMAIRKAKGVLLVLVFLLWFYWVYFHGGLRVPQYIKTTSANAYEYFAGKGDRYTECWIQPQSVEDCNRIGGLCRKGIFKGNPNQT